MSSLFSTFAEGKAVEMAARPSTSMEVKERMVVYVELVIPRL